MRRGVLILAVSIFGSLISGPTAQAGGMCDNAENDTFANAIEIVLLDHGDTCDNSLADPGAPGEPTPTCAVGKAPGRTLWWKYKPTVSTQSHIKVNTYESVTGTGTPLNTIVSLWKGTDVSNIVEIACNDNVAANKGSRITQALDLNQQYYVQVATVSGATGTVRFRMKPRTWLPGVVRGDDWYFNNAFDGTADFQIVYGQASDNKLAGNWAGHGVHTPWVHRGNLWLANDWFDSGFAEQFTYGLANDFPLIGDWNGTDETLTAGINRGNLFHLNNGFDGTADISVAFGSASDYPLVGDWDGNGTWTPGVRRGNVWYLSNDFNGGSVVTPFPYGSASDFPVVGDWNADGKMTPGVVRANQWYLNNGFDGVADIPGFAYGSSTDRKIVGDWDGVVE